MREHVSHHVSVGGSGSGSGAGGNKKKTVKKKDNVVVWTLERRRGDDGEYGGDIICVG